MQLMATSLLFSINEYIILFTKNSSVILYSTKHTIGKFQHQRLSQN
jgi:hypothetical protein